MCCRLQLSLVARNKYIFVVVGILLIAGATGGWFWRKHKITQNDLALRRAASSKTLGSSSNLDDSPSSLSVNGGDGSATNLGQLDPNSEQSGLPVSGGTKKQSSPFDPATFSQYDKYKDAESGLFADVQLGTGAELTNGKKGAVYYKGWLTNGQLFDQSVTDEHDVLQPFVFTMGAHSVIPGWEQALYGMKVGGVRLVIVPPAVGYGEAGHAPIPSNAVLIFQVQLAAVE